MSVVIKIIASGLGSGNSPFFPGTVGSLLAALIAGCYRFHLWQIFVLCLVGVYICNKAEKILNEHDSPRIVFDEFCGLFIAVWNISNIYFFIIAFLLFRCFDILKPFPINKLQELPGGWGVMADDIAAGLAARLLTAVIMVLF